MPTILSISSIALKCASSPSNTDLGVKVAEGKKKFEGS